MYLVFKKTEKQTQQTNTKQFKNHFDEYKKRMFDYVDKAKKEMIKEILQWGQKSEYERKIIGEENRNYIIKNFSSETIGEKYLHLISNL